VAQEYQEQYNLAIKTPPQPLPAMQGGAYMSENPVLPPNSGGDRGGSHTLFMYQILLKLPKFCANVEE